MSWPNRVWVETPDGWASREPTVFDHRRRRYVEFLLANQNELSAAEKAKAEKEIQRCRNAVERLDRHVVWGRGRAA